MAPLCFTDHAQPQDMWLILQLRQEESFFAPPSNFRWLRTCSLCRRDCCVVFKLGLSLEGWYCQSQLGRERWLAGTDKNTQPVGLRAAFCAQQLWGDVVHLVPAWLFEGWNMYMVPQGRGRSGSSFGKVAASRPIPFAWWWRKLVPDG